MPLHHLSAEEIAAYLDGECTETEFRNAQAHMDACEECRATADDQRFIKSLMGSLEEPDLPRSFTISEEMVNDSGPLSSPHPESSPAAGGGSGSGLIRFEPFARIISIAAVLAFLVLGGAHLAGIGNETEPGNDQPVAVSETESSTSALEEQEPELARGEVREQGESAAANISPLHTESASVETQAQATDNGLTRIEITTIGVGVVALASIAAWILIHFRAGQPGNNS